MRIQDTTGEEEAPPSLLPLIDMVFLLLIFFLVATTISQEEREADIQLPRTSEAEPLSAPPQQLIINILADGALRVGGVTVAPEALRGLLERLAMDEPQREVLIRADERSIHRYFAGVVRLCREAGINKLKIGYLLKVPPAAGGR